MTDSWEGDLEDLGTLLHDLRTPLAAILGLAITLEREDVALKPDEARDLVSRISDNARRLDRMEPWSSRSSHRTSPSSPLGWSRRRR